MSCTTLRLALYSGICLFTICLPGCANGPGRYIAKLWSRNTVLTDEQAQGMRTEEESGKSRVVANTAITTQTDDATGRVNLAELVNESDDVKSNRQILASFFRKDDDKDTEDDKDTDVDTDTDVDKQEAPPFENEPVATGSKKNLSGQTSSKKPTLVLPYQEITAGSITQNALRNQQKPTNSSDSKNTFADDFDQRLAELRSSIRRDAITVDEDLVADFDSYTASQTKQNAITKTVKLTSPTANKSNRPKATEMSQQSNETSKNIDLDLFEAIDRELAQKETKQQRNELINQQESDAVILLPEKDEPIAVSKTDFILTRSKAATEPITENLFNQSQVNANWLESYPAQSGIMAETDTADFKSDAKSELATDQAARFEKSKRTAIAKFENRKQFQSSNEMLIDTDTNSFDSSSPAGSTSSTKAAVFTANQGQRPNRHMADYNQNLLPPDRIADPDRFRAPPEKQTKLVPDRESPQNKVEAVAEPHAQEKLLEQLQSQRGSQHQNADQPASTHEQEPIQPRMTNRKPDYELPVIVPRTRIEQLSAKSHVSANHSASLAILEEPLLPDETSGEPVPALLQLGNPIFEESKPSPKPEAKQENSESKIEQIGYEQAATLTPILEPALLKSGDSAAKPVVAQTESLHAKLFVIACALAVVIGVILRYRSDYLSQQ